MPPVVATNSVFHNLGQAIHAIDTDVMAENNILTDNFFAVHLECSAGGFGAREHLLFDYNDLYGNRYDFYGEEIASYVGYHNLFFALMCAVSDAFVLPPFPKRIDAGKPLEAFLDDDGFRNDLGAYGGHLLHLPRGAMPKVCYDGVDNDGNDEMDCDGPACQESPRCEGE